MLYIFFLNYCFGHLLFESGPSISTNLHPRRHHEQYFVWWRCRGAKMTLLSFPITPDEHPRSLPRTPRCHHQGALVWLRRQGVKKIPDLGTHMQIPPTPHIPHVFTKSCNSIKGGLDKNGVSCIHHFYLTTYAEFAQIPLCQPTDHAFLQILWFHPRRAR